MGVLGGTFDPVHVGHLIVAQEVASAMGLDGVIFVPARQPWLKGDRPISPAEQRLEMLRLALEGEPTFTLSLVDLDRAGPSYTVDTLSDLGGEASLYFILGWDALRELPRWWQPRRLVEMCRLVAVPRPGSPRPDLEALDREVPGIAGRTRLLEEPLIGISSTEVRRRVMEGLPIRFLVPEAVERYIKDNGLYVNAAKSAG
ncbi:MAG: nicotinate-nucleotide adenylyltransferase [Dehalococcoidia bacterium]